MDCRLATPKCQATFPSTISHSLFQFIYIESVVLSNHHILCHPLSSCLNVSQHQSLFQWVGFLHQGTKVLELQLQQSSFQLIFRVDLISLLSKGLSRVFSNTTIWEHQFFSAQPSLQSSSHIFIADSWKKHSIDFTYEHFSAKWCFYFSKACLGLSWLSFQRESIF